MARFERVYEEERIQEYSDLLTSNFRFHFSASADPLLVANYPNGWSKTDDTTSTGHLFRGFTNAQGTHERGAASIAVSLLPSNAPESDTTHADSTAWYKVLVVPFVELSVMTGPDDGFLIHGRHEVSLVRGDAAVLSAGQRADSTCWYIYRWEDQSPAGGAAASSHSEG
jgi:hypothetical protein